MAKDQLVLRLYFEPQLYELARLVNYGGIRDRDLEPGIKELSGRYGGDRVAQALFELTTKDEKSGVITLRPHVRKLCWQLLGPPPEHPEYARYYETNKRNPPENHQPPKAEEPSPAPRKGRKRRQP